MTIQELIDGLTLIVAHGADPGVQVESWDPDGEGWFPVTSYTYGAGEPLRFYCDIDEEEPAPAPAPEEPEPPRVVDLMAALEASLAAVKKGRAL